MLTSASLETTVYTLFARIARSLRPNLLTTAARTHLPCERRLVTRSALKTGKYGRLKGCRLFTLGPSSSPSSSSSESIARSIKCIWNLDEIRYRSFVGGKKSPFLRRTPFFLRRPRFHNTTSNTGSVVSLIGTPLLLSGCNGDDDDATRTRTPHGETVYKIRCRDVVPTYTHHHPMCSVRLSTYSAVL